MKIQVTSHDSDEKENGFLSVEWIGAISLLLLPAFIVVFSLIQVPNRKNLSQVASAAAARAYVQALDQSQADAAARAAAAEAIQGETKDKTDISSSAAVDKFLDDHQAKVELVDPSNSHYCPGAEITIKVTLPLPLSFNPFQGTSSPFPVGSLSSTSTERIDDYAELADQESTGTTYPFDVDAPGVCSE